MVRAALAFAVEVAQSREGRTEWGGLSAYGKWIAGLESGNEISSDGAGYHAAIWAECRAFAVDFLKESRVRLGDEHHDLFDRATAHYTQVRDRSLSFVAAPDSLGNLAGSHQYRRNISSQNTAVAKLDTAPDRGILPDDATCANRAASWGLRPRTRERNGHHGTSRHAQR